MLAASFLPASTARKINSACCSFVRCRRRMLVLITYAAGSLVSLHLKTSLVWPSGNMASSLVRMNVTSRRSNAVRRLRPSRMQIRSG